MENFIFDQKNETNSISFLLYLITLISYQLSILIP